jgi:hypothetical protein
VTPHACSNVPTAAQGSQAGVCSVLVAQVRGLHEAAMRGNLEIIRLLLADCGADAERVRDQLAAMLMLELYSSLSPRFVVPVIRRSRCGRVGSSGRS